MRLKDEKNMKNKYLELLSLAINRFYLNDAKSLFGANKQIDERAMVGCIYRYMWSILEQQKIEGVQMCDIDVDIEYDRMNGCQGEEIKKHINIVMEHCQKCTHKESCIELIKRYMKVDKKTYDFRPDIILHKRGACSQKGNFMVVEVKKDISSAQRIKFDEAKVRYCTCDNAPLRYAIGATVVLSENGAMVQTFTSKGLGKVFHVN